MSRLAQYESLLDLSRHMAELARQQAWEALAELETRRAALLSQLPPDIATLPVTEQTGIAATIRQIQECDETVLAYVMPWREQAGTLLTHLKPGP